MTWQVWALLSAGFAALTAIFAKVGVANINSDLATLIRVAVNILGYRRPTEEADLQVLLGRFNPDGADSN